MDIEVYAYEIELNENKSRVIHGYLQSKHHFFSILALNSFVFQQFHLTRLNV